MAIRALSETEIAEVAQMRHQYKDWGEIAKTLHIRKQNLFGALKEVGITPESLKPPPIRVKWGSPEHREKRGWDTRKEWRMWQLVANCVFVRLEGDFKFGVSGFHEYTKIWGYSKAHDPRDFNIQAEECINYAMAQLKGSGWQFKEFKGMYWRRWHGD